MKLQRGPSRLLCSCGKPLDRFGVEYIPGAAAPSQPHAASIDGGRGGLSQQSPAGPRRRRSVLGAVDPDSYKRTTRYEWRCRRCRAHVQLGAHKLSAAWFRAAAEGRTDDLVVGIDV